MRNYSHRFRRNYRGGWLFDDKKEEGAQTPESSEPGFIEQTENKATEAFNKVTSMLPSFSGSNQPTEQPMNGGRRSRRSRRSSRKSKRRRSRRR